MSSIFTQIIRGDIPCERLLEDERYLAFMDIRPIQPGHSLVIPKQETDDLFDLDNTLLSGILPFAKQVAAGIKAVVPCNRVGLMVAGLEVPHAHIHLVPITTISQLNFEHAQAISPAQLRPLADQIRAKLALP
tara:strand:- start:283 stop:681 length:399 start_codon:yes stop_codon:yes gene_type:complete